jgi:hypothetical protein
MQPGLSVYPRAQAALGYEAAATEGSLARPAMEVSSMKITTKHLLFRVDFP